MENRFDYINGQTKTFEAAAAAGYVWAHDERIAVEAAGKPAYIRSVEYPAGCYELVLYREGYAPAGLGVYPMRYLIDCPALFGKVVQKTVPFYTPGHIQAAFKKAFELIDSEDAR